MVREPTAMGVLFVVLQWRIGGHESPMVSPIVPLKLLASVVARDMVGIKL